jgi:protoporphyrinogen oxidase
MKFIALGAGLSGLSCAVALRRQGHDVLVIEKDPVVGGLAKSYRVKGYTFDYGPHFVFGSGAVPLLKDILAPKLNLMPMNRNLERVYFRNRYFKFPFEPKNLLLNMEPKKVPGALFDLLLGRILRKLDHSSVKNVEDWVVSAVGRRLYDYTSLGGYIQKLYGIPPMEVAKDWGIQKLKFLGRLQGADLLQLGLKALSEGKKLQSQVVNYPPGGIDWLASHIADRLTDLGGRIQLHSEASAIERRSSGVVLHFKKDGLEETIEGDFLVSTIPVSSLISIIHPSPPKDIVKATHFLKYRTLLLVFICIAKERVLDYQCIYFTEKDVPFRRITEFKNLDYRMAPEGKSSLCVEMTCFEGDAISMSDQHTIFASVVGELQRRGFVNEKDIEHYAVIKMPYAYPVYDIGYNCVLDQVLNYLGGVNRVLSIGRQGLFHYNTMSNSILAGYQVGLALSDAQQEGFDGLIQNVYGERTGKYNLN